MMLKPANISESHCKKTQVKFGRNHDILDRPGA